MDRSRYLSYWGGRFAPEFMAGINRNRRQERIGMSGRNSPENAGEEFMILSPKTGMEGALAISEKIRVAVETYSYPAGVRITISAGVAEWFREDSVAAFIRKVDETLYVAKNRGRNRVEAAERPA